MMPVQSGKTAPYCTKGPGSEPSRERHLEPLRAMTMTVR
jgi:hypothetical protein